MKRNNVIGFIIVAAVVVLAVVAVSLYLRKTTPLIVQGTVECTTYKASSKVAGRIDEMKVAEGDSVERGELLYTLSTPELEAKMQQAEAAKSAAEAQDKAAIAGARVQQIEGALGLWQKAQAGEELARKTFERVQSLHAQGVVPQQQLDEASANYSAMQATAKAAKSQYDMAMEGARAEDKEAAAALVRQAAGAIDEVQAYMNDAAIYAPVSGEVSSIIAQTGELVGSGYPVVAILDLHDVWITFNIREDLLPDIRVGMHVQAGVPALGHDVELEITHISAQADFATWSATRAQGGFDVRTFAVKAKPVPETAGLRPGMSVLVDWGQFKHN